MSAAEWIQTGLDVVLIALVGMGLVQATRLIRHLAGLRQSRREMENFVQEFSATVMRAEVGIKGLRQAARESGDDLEKLIEKGSSLRDELHFLVESADQIAARLGETATNAVRAVDRQVAEKPAARPEFTPEPATADPTPLAKKSSTPAGPKPSRAEEELMQALKKLG